MIAIKSLYAPVVGRLPFAGEKASGDSALFVAVIRHAFTAFAVSQAGIGAGAGACVVAVGHSLLLARGSAFFDYAAFCRRCQRPPFSTWRGRTLFSYPAASPCKHDGGFLTLDFYLVVSWEPHAYTRLRLASGSVTSTRADTPTNKTGADALFFHTPPRHRASTMAAG